MRFGRHICRTRGKIAIFLTSFSLFLLCGSHCHGQTAISDASHIKAALNPSGRQIAQITLNGTVDTVAGSSHATGSVTLIAVTDGSATEQWSLDAGPHIVEQGALSETRSCSEGADRSNAAASKSANCLQTVPWFAPWVAPLLVGDFRIAVTQQSAPDGRVSFSYSVDPYRKLKAHGMASAGDPSSVVITYDQATLLPLTLEYKIYTGSAASHAIEVLVRFEDYATESGVILPHHIQKFVQNTLQYDLKINSVQVQ